MSALKNSLLAARDNNLIAAQPKRLPLYAQKWPRVLSVVLLAMIALAIPLAVHHLQKPASEGDGQPSPAKTMAVETATQIHDADERRTIQDWIGAHKKARFIPIFSARHVEARQVDPFVDPYTPVDVFTITDADLASLADIHGMTIIDLQGCENVTGKGLSKLDGRNVSRLSCKDTSFTDEDLKSLANFPKLQYLNLSSTGITDKGLALLLLKAPEVQYLVINSCSSITDEGLGPLFKMPQLTSLDMRDIALGAKGVSFLGKSKLLAIKVSNTGITDDDLKVIAQNKHLQALSLDGCHQITGAGLRYLFDLPLRTLDIGDCKLSAAAVSAFRKAVPGCTMFYTRGKFNGGQVRGVMEDLFKP
jgi:hypothetical protein